MNTFNPSDAISADFGIFGLPISEQESTVVLLPVPWEVTTSYGWGASLGPQIIRQASEQIDLFDIETGKAYEAGYFMRAFPNALYEKNKKMKTLAQELIELKTNMDTNEKKQAELLSSVNRSCEEMSNWVYQQTKEILTAGKLFGLVGGDHSTPFGAIRAICEQHQNQVGILHIDAHADLRNSYQGFAQSHASIMHNVMTKIRPAKLVQVGIRDFCEEEYEFSKNHPNIKTFFDIEYKKRLLKGETWAHIAEEIINELPEKVYVSFDIDGLDPALCPHTGTPVAGGLSLDQIFYLLSLLQEKKKQLVGFDLNEVSGGDMETATDESEWDGNVGARILYKLCGWLVVTNTNKPRP